MLHYLTEFDTDPVEDVDDVDQQIPLPFTEETEEVEDDEFEDEEIEDEDSLDESDSDSVEEEDEEQA